MLRLVTTFLAVATVLGASGTPMTDFPEKWTIQFSQGEIEGIREEVEGYRTYSGDHRYFYSFTAMPYAVPPVGDHRFKDPEYLEKWDGPRQSHYPPRCTQMDPDAWLHDKEEVIGEEDCLTLNVYTPNPHDDAELPVMVFIHGGGFAMGEPETVGGSPTPAMQKDIVLVTIQYRLGPLGFLSTEDDVMHGNYGLRDQTMALKWVEKNIHSFGGDHHNVTLYGSGAGAASVHYHILSPYSRGLFHRAIMQSGTALNLWAIRDDHKESAIHMSNRLGCPSEDSNALHDCFMGKSDKELVKASFHDTKMLIPFYMTPRVDHDFLPEHPGQLLREGHYNKVDILAGVNQNEGAHYLLMYMRNSSIAQMNPEHIDTYGSHLIFFDNQRNKEYLTRRAYYYYMNEHHHVRDHHDTHHDEHKHDIDLTPNNAERLEELLSDAMSNYFFDEASKFHARDAEYGWKVYRYELQHRAESSFCDIFDVPVEEKNHWISNSDDLLYISDNVFGGVKPFKRQDDLFLRDIVLELWYNFAKYGNPTPNYELGFKWEAMNSTEDLRYLSLTPSPIMRPDNRTEAREKWEEMPLKQNMHLHPEKFFDWTKYDHQYHHHYDYDDHHHRQFRWNRHKWM